MTEGNRLNVFNGSQARLDRLGVEGWASFLEISQKVLAVMGIIVGYLWLLVIFNDKVLCFVSRCF